MLSQQLFERQAKPCLHSRIGPWARTPLKAPRKLRVNGSSSAALQASRVEEWKHMLDSETSPNLRNTMCDLLVAAPAAVHHCPTEMKEIVKLLHSYTRVQRLYSSSPTLLPYEDMLALHQRYTPHTLAQRLERLSVEVSRGLDASVQGADLLVAVAPCIVPLLEAPPGAIAQRAAALSELIPEFLPSSILRAIPELLIMDWDTQITKDFVNRAGDVVIFGRGVRASLFLSGQAVPGLATPGACASRSSDSPSDSSVASHSAASGLGSESSMSEGAFCSSSSSSSGGGSGGNDSSSGKDSSSARSARSNGGSRRRPSGRVAGSGGSHTAASLAQLSLPGSKVAIYTAAPTLPNHQQQQQPQQQQQEGQGQQVESSSGRGFSGVHAAQPQQPPQQQQQEEGHQLMAVVTNSRCLIFAGGGRLSERYADPYRDEEALVSCGAGKPGSWNTPGQVPGAFFRDQPRMWLLWPSLTDSR